MSAKEIINTCGLDQMTSEHTAFDNDIVTKIIEENDIESMKKIISKDIRSTPNRKGQTGLFHCNSTEMCKVLLDDGASTNRHDIYNRSAMTYAIMNGYHEIATMMADHRHTSTNTIMTTALQTLSEPFIRHICNTRRVGPANIDHTFMRGINLLHSFIIKRHLAMVKFLLEFGVNPDMVTMQGKTTEKLSQDNRQPSPITFILRNVSIQNKNEKRHPNRSPDTNSVE